MQKTLQILIPLTRGWRIEGLTKQLNECKFINKGVVVSFVIDNPRISKRSIPAKFENKNILEVKSFVFKNGTPSEGNVFERRRRIAQVLNFARTKLDKNIEKTLIIEDDTFFAENHFKWLWYDYQLLSKNGADVGLVSGVQAGRWALKIVGAWIVDDLEAKVLKSVDFTRKEIIKKVDATGLYFVLTDTKNILEHEFSGNDLAPDVDFGIALRKKGKQNYIDWTVSTGHVMRDKTIYCDEDCVSIIYQKTKKGLWKITEQIS